MTHLVLSGGGTRGVLAHAGAVQYLLDHRVPIHGIAGTSAGALVAYVTALGYDPATIAEDLLGNQTLARFRPHRRRGLWAAYPHNRILEALQALHRTPFKHTLQVRTSNLATRTEHIWRSDQHPHAPWSHVVLASMAIPFVFMPVRIHGQDHVDGGLASNFPLDAWAPHPTTGLYVTGDTPANNPTDTRSYVQRIVDVAINANVREDIDDTTPSTTRIIRLKGHGSSLNFGISARDARTLIQWGYRSMERQWTQ